ncbi:MAG: anti-sigma factor [Arcicella sp.]|nr:anti-sigma factor [Arcicella sp.]
MNTKEYIESGIIESYVLGASTIGESTEVERMALEYSDINAEVESVRNTLESYVLQYEKEPPAFLKDKIMAEIFSVPLSADRFQSAVNRGHSAVGTDQLAGDSNQSSENSQPLSVNVNQIDENSREIVSLNNSASQRSIFRMAASWALLALSIGGNIWFFKNWKNSEDKLVALETQNQVLAQEGKALKASYQEEVAILQNPNFKIIKLLGQKDAPDATALVYFDKIKQEVYLSALRLPQAPTGKQYQLWAIIDGKPVDAGMINGAGNVLRMKALTNAVAFAISLENTGGSTTEAGPKGVIYVMGAV